jgi:cytoskeletal protein CcmA (bactofilin family)
MGATYTRQSSYTDGDTITAAHTNDEFDQLLAAFQASTGHTHDGTANEGGPVTKLLGNTLTFGAGTAGTDITVTFDGESNDGVLYWMEDEDYFKFSDDILINSTEKLYFQDTGTYIYSNADGDLDLVSDGTNADAIKLASSGGITLDAAGDIILDADGDDITLKNGSATYGSFTNSSGELVIKSGSTPTTAMTFSGANVTFSGTVTIGSAGISEAELEILDGATVTTTELNIIDGDTTASSTTVADADRVVFNDGGTMKQVAVTDLAAYFDDEITAMPNLTSVGTLTTLTVDNVIINGSTIGHTGDTDLMTVASGVLTVAGEVDATSLDISGNADIDGTTNLDAVDIDGATQIDATLSVGVDDTGYDVKFFGATSGKYMEWDESADQLDVTGSFDVTGNSTMVGTLTVGVDDTGHDVKFFGATAGSYLLWDESADSLLLTDSTPIKIGDSQDFTLYHDGSNSYITNATGALKVATETSGIAITLGHSTSEVTVADNLTVTGDLTVNGTTTTVNSTTVTIDDPIFTLGGDTAPGSDDNKDRGIEFRYHDGSSARVGFFGYDDSASAFTFLTAATNSSEVFSGTVGNVTGGIGTFSSLDISGAIDVDGTTNLDAVDVDGTVQIDGATTFGVDDTGVDVKFFGATSGAYLLWDESADKLLTAGGAVVDIVKDKLLIGGTAVTTTAAELNVLDAVTGGTVTANLAVVVDSNKDIGSFRNITLTGELDAGSLDVSGDADIDGTLEADAITVNGSTLSSVIQDEATALAIALG